MVLVLLSPSKTLDESPLRHSLGCSQPQLLNESERLVEILRGYSAAKLSQLMGLSKKLSDLNYQRYQSFNTPFTPQNAKQAILMFKGDVYEGLDAESFSSKDFQQAQQTIRVLSGLYGLLRPLDLMQPYRLEMGTKLPNKRGKDLYAFWGERITDVINQELQNANDNLLINLASNEYYKAVHPKKVHGEVVTVSFKEQRGGDYKVIGLLAKKARGMMARYIIQSGAKKRDDLLGFNAGGYQYAPAFSSENTMVFVR